MDTTMKKIFLLLILTILCGSSVFAQDSALQDSVQQNKYNFSQFANETWGFIKQPTNWDGGDWLRLGILGASTFLVMQTDEPIRHFLNYDKKYAKSFPMEFGNVWGELYFTELLFGGLTF